jgi:dTMP kinase
METTGVKGRGAFIVVEGLDRSGKTTQTKRIESALLSEGYKVKLRRFPGNSIPLGPRLFFSVPDSR